MTITFDSTEKPYLQTFPWDQTSSTSECRKEPLWALKSFLENIFKTSSETAAATLDDDMQTFVGDTCSHKKEQFDKKKEMIQQKTWIVIT